MAGVIVIEIVEDRFFFDPESREMRLDEPATLLGDRIVRTMVHRYRVDAGWQLMTTLYDEDELSLIDLWSNTGLPSTQPIRHAFPQRESSPR